MAHSLKKGRIVAIVGSIVLVLAVGLTVILMMNRNEYGPRTLAEVKTQASKPPKHCTVQPEQIKLGVPSQDRDSIYTAASTRIIDIPASTEVTVDIIDYSEPNASGVVTYGGDYGSYNFSATKQLDAWHVTAFELCTK